MSTAASARPEQAEQASACNSQSTISAEQNDKPRLGPVTPGSVLSFLHQRVQKLDAHELRFLSGATECASHMAYNLGNTVSNIGCMIDADYMPGCTSAGNFEIPDNVVGLLSVIADQIRVISELAQIGSDAYAMLDYQERGHV